MPVYWSFFAAPFVIRALQTVFERRKIISSDKKKQDAALIVIFFSWVIFFLGLRSGVADTWAYISGYKEMPDNMTDYVVDFDAKDWLFGYLSCLFKSVTKASFQTWLFTIALISGVAAARGIYKYSSCMWLSCYLFVASSLFTYMLNGMRQFIALSVLFCNADMILEKKYVRYILLIALLSQIHGSAWFMLLLIPLSRFKPWSLQMFAIIALGCVFATNFESFAGTVDSVLENTQYSGMGETIANGTGSNIFRFLVSAVPPIIAFLSRDKVRDENSKLLDMMVNCSVMCMVTMFVSSLTFGIFLGRVAAYFDIFNLALLPWLIYHSFDKRFTRLVIFASVIFYGVFFYYQMVVAWRMYYISNVLNLKV